MTGTAISKTALWLSALGLLSACAPEREFVRFGNPGTFHPGRPEPAGQFHGPEGEYDSYELIDHGAPNHGVPAMYSGRQGGVPVVVDTYDAYGNPRRVVVPNPW